MTKEGLIAEFKITNIGSFSGSAIPMMFLTFPENIREYPKYIFKGFEKIDVDIGETKNVSIIADAHLFLNLMLKKMNILGLIKVKLKFILQKMEIQMKLS